MKFSVVVVVDWRFCCSWSRWPFSVAIEGGKCFVISDFVSPGHVMKKPFWMAVVNVDVVGLKQAA